MRTPALLLLLLLTHATAAPGRALAQPGDAAEAKAEAAVSKAEAAAAKAEAAAATADAKTEAAVTKAGAAADKADSLIGLIQWLAFAFGIIAAVVGYFGFKKQESFDEVLAGMRKLEAEMGEKVREIEAVRAELGGLKESLHHEFNEARQALVMLGLGNSVFDSGRVRDAIPYYEAARGLLPDHPDINYRLGRGYVNSRRYEDAIRVLQKAVDVRPNYPEAHMELGLAYRREADNPRPEPKREAMYRLAEHHLLRAIDLRPDYVDALGTLGGLYKREGDYERAFDCYKRAERADPYSTYGPINIAILAWREGRRDLALEYFARVERLSEADILAGGERKMWALADRAVARLAQGRTDDALRDQREALELTTSHDHYESALTTLRLLAGPPNPMPGVERFIELVEAKMR